jgi:hypothetical protein
MRLALLALLAFALAGCGSSGGGSYAQELSSTLASVSAPASLDAGTLAKLAHDYAGVADRIGRLTPPAAVAQPHAQLVASLHAYANDLATAATLTTSQAAFASEMARAQADAQSWTAAFQQIKSQGYAA